MQSPAPHVTSLVIGVIIGSVGYWILGKLTRKSITNGSNCNQEEQKRGVLVGDEEQILQEEQFKRNIQFLGEENFAKLKNSRIVIVGLGGTGSHAAHLLARSGVEALRLIDFDQVWFTVKKPFNL